jgi:Na+-translocating ferredoxin:NAD+ oxidoreductase RNF subunit RnfB
VCRALTGFSIDAERCDGCRACVKVCPTDAVVGVAKAVHQIKTETCIACGACFDACPTGAVTFFAKRERQQEQAHADLHH